VRGTIYTKPNTRPWDKCCRNAAGLAQHARERLRHFNLTIPRRRPSFIHRMLPRVSQFVVDTGAAHQYRRTNHLTWQSLSNAVVATGGMVGVTPKASPKPQDPGPGSSVSGLGAGAGYGGFGGDSATAAAASLTLATQPVIGEAAAVWDPARFPEAPGRRRHPPECGAAHSHRRAISAEGNAGVQDNSGGGSGAASGSWQAAAGNGLHSPGRRPGRTVGGSGGSGGRIEHLSSFSRIVKPRTSRAGSPPTGKATPGA